MVVAWNGKWLRATDPKLVHALMEGVNGGYMGSGLADKKTASCSWVTWGISGHGLETLGVGMW